MRNNRSHSKPPTLLTFGVSPRSLCRIYTREPLMQLETRFKMAVCSDRFRMRCERSPPCFLAEVGQLKHRFRISPLQHIADHEATIPYNPYRSKPQTRAKRESDLEVHQPEVLSSTSASFRQGRIPTVTCASVPSYSSMRVL